MVTWAQTKVKVENLDKDLKIKRNEINKRTLKKNRLIMKPHLRREKIKMVTMKRKQMKSLMKLLMTTSLFV